MQVKLKINNMTILLIFILFKIFILAPIDMIDQSLFVDIIALCALDLTFREPEPTDLEKVDLNF